MFYRHLLFLFCFIEVEDEGQGPNMSEYELITYLTEMVSNYILFL